METKYYETDEKNIDMKALEDAAAILQEGGLVAFPTETVYGLGANGLDGVAVKKIFEAKGRPTDNPLILHIANQCDLAALVTEITPVAQKLINRFWPGPLTIILPSSAKIPQEVTAGLNTVAVRLPKNKIARKLIALAGVPIAAPSANSSGRPSPTNAAMVKEDLWGCIDVIISSGSCDIGLESTVVDCTGDNAVVLRPGEITVEMIEAACLHKVEPYNHHEIARPRSPGMKYRHYSPGKPVILVNGDDVKHLMGKIVEREQGKGFKVAVFSSQAVECYLQDSMEDKNGAIFIVTWLNLRDMAKKLYATLVECEVVVDVICVEGVADEGLGKAIMNRLRKSASEIIEA